MAKNDFLRQVIGYEYPNYPWEKDNYSIRDVRWTPKTGPGNKVVFETLILGVC
jgi:hypothetical protein